MNSCVCHCWKSHKVADKPQLSSFILDYKLLSHNQRAATTLPDSCHIDVSSFGFALHPQYLFCYTMASNNTATSTVQVGFKSRKSIYLYIDIYTCELPNISCQGRCSQHLSMESGVQSELILRGVHIESQNS